MGLCLLPLVSSNLLLGTLRLEDEDDYEYKFSVLSTRIRFGGQHFSKCACSEQKTCTRSRPRPPIERSLLPYKANAWCQSPASSTNNAWSLHQEPTISWFKGYALHYWGTLGQCVWSLFKHSKTGNEKKKCHCGAKNCSSFLGVRPKNQIQDEKPKKTGDKRKKKKIKKPVVKEGMCAKSI